MRGRYAEKTWGEHWSSRFQPISELTQDVLNICMEVATLTPRKVANSHFPGTL